jgi:hypothetical protein
VNVSIAGQRPHSACEIGMVQVLVTNVLHKQVGKRSHSSPLTISLDMTGFMVMPYMGFPAAVILSIFVIVCMELQTVL